MVSDFLHQCWKFDWRSPKKLHSVYCFELNTLGGDMFRNALIGFLTFFLSALLILIVKCIPLGKLLTGSNKDYKIKSKHDDIARLELWYKQRWLQNQSFA